MPVQPTWTQPGRRRSSGGSSKRPDPGLLAQVRACSLPLPTTTCPGISLVPSPSIKPAASVAKQFGSRSVTSSAAGWESAVAPVQARSACSSSPAMHFATVSYLPSGPEPAPRHSPLTRRRKWLGQVSGPASSSHCRDSPGPSRGGRLPRLGWSAHSAHQRTRGGRQPCLAATRGSARSTSPRPGGHRIDDWCRSRCRAAVWLKHPGPGPGF